MEGAFIMSVDIERALGRIEGNLDSLTKSVDSAHKDTREDFAKVFASIRALEQKGCALGTANVERIHKLETRPKTRRIGLGRTAVLTTGGTGLVVSIIEGVKAYLRS